MAKVALTLQAVSTAGLTPSFGAANADGYAIDNSSGRAAIYVKNGGGAGITVTLEIPGSIDGVAKADKTVSIGAGAEKIIGFFPRNVYDQTEPDTSMANAVGVTFSSVTSVTVAGLLFS